MYFPISDDDLDTNRIIIKSNNGNTINTNHHNSVLDTFNDLDNEEAALHEFDFLTGDTAASATTGRRIKTNFFFYLILDIDSGDWNIDQTRINRLKEEYKRDRHVKQTYQSTTITNATSASIRNSLLNNGSDDISSDQRTFSEDEQSIKLNSKSIL